MRPAILLLAIFASNFLVSEVQSDSEVSSVSIKWISTEKYMKLREDYRRTYVAGSLESIVRAANILNRAAKDRGLENLSFDYNDCLDGKSLEQLTAVFDSYLADHPEHWHYLLSDQLHLAVDKFCGFTS